MLTNCLAECAHLAITVSEIERDIGRKSSIFHTPLHLTPPLGGFPSEYCHPVWHGKTRMVWLPDGEKISKISLFVLAQLTNVTDAQTDRRTPGDGIYRAYAYASRGNNCHSRNQKEKKLSLSNSKVHVADYTDVFVVIFY